MGETAAYKGPPELCAGFREELHLTDHKLTIECHSTFFDPGQSAEVTIYTHRLKPMAENTL
jgi:hypothetical protein